MQILLLNFLFSNYPCLKIVQFLIICKCSSWEILLFFIDYLNFFLLISSIIDILLYVNLLFTSFHILTRQLPCKSVSRMFITSSEAFI